ncbi:MAG: hypothetical protein H8D23_24225 [Candidatus Brocadiales bacterium]|nr:hypothetical protein [Candidatus Brocadiales bacterium]
MATIQKVSLQDFEKIYPLFSELPSNYLTKEDWRQSFINHWHSTEDYCGYVLLDQDEVVGYLGIVFSDREINGRRQKFCNFHTWVVKDQYRSEALLLLYPLLRLRGYTLTNFTPSENVYTILKRLGFKDYENRIKLIPFLPTISSLTGEWSFWFDNDKIEHVLNEKDLNIYHDHLRFKCAHVLVKKDNTYCYMILTRVKKKHLPFAVFNYISHLGVFLERVWSICPIISMRLRVLGLLIYEQDLKGHNIRPSLTVSLKNPMLFKSEVLSRGDIDTLYSECVVLSQ